MRILLFLIALPLMGLNTETSYPYLSGYTWLYFADWRLTALDYGRDFSESFDPKKVQKGDTIFVEISCIEKFATDYLPQINDPIILITANYGFCADESLPGPYAYLLKEPKIAYWLVQNIDTSPTDRLIPIPIGITNKCFAIGNIALFDRWIAASNLRSHFLYINFTFDINRLLCYHHFKQLNAKIEERKPFEAYLKDLSQSIFVVSPPGNGLDCHRTWEALLLGCYPIVLSSTLNPLYKDLPVVIVESWEDVTESFLHQKYEELERKTFSKEKLYAPFWFEKVRQLQTKLKNG